MPKEEKHHKHHYSVSVSQPASVHSRTKQKIHSKHSDTNTPWNTSPITSVKTTGIHKPKSKPSHPNSTSLEGQVHPHPTQENVMIALQNTISKTISTFEAKLANCVTVNIATKKKLLTEKPLPGKTGHIVTIKDEPLGLLISSGEPLCCGRNRTENDPLNYALVNPDEDNLLEIRGLDYTSSDTENSVIISLSILKTKLGTVAYNYLGADGETLSKVTVQAGRDVSYVVPTAVYNSTGEFIYIFRSDQDTFGYSEILLADGSALIVAEVLVNYKPNKIKSTSTSVSQAEGKPQSFSLNFLEPLSGKDKALILGVTVTLFNQWLSRRKKKKLCYNYCPIL